MKICPWNSKEMPKESFLEFMKFKSGRCKIDTYHPRNLSLMKFFKFANRESASTGICEKLRPCKLRPLRYHYSTKCFSSSGNSYRSDWVIGYA